MTATGQFIGHGSQLELQVGSVYTPINGVVDIAHGSDKVDVLDTTDMGTTGTTRAFTPGLENPGDFSVKLNFLPGDTTQAALYAAKGVVSNFKAVWPGATHNYAFAGILTSIDENVPDDKLATMTAKIQVTGAISIT